MDKTYSECYAWRPAVSVTQTNDGTYILGTQHHDTLSNYNSNIIRTDSLGIQLWNVTGPSLPYNNHTVCAEQTLDGGYILSATIVDSLSINNNTNIHIIKYDSFGNQQWNMTYLDSLFNNVEDIQQTNDDGFIICGTKDNFAGSGVHRKTGIYNQN